MSSHKSLNKIAITTGDVDGIGLEVSVKALARLGPQKNSIFFLWRSSKAPKKLVQSLDKKFKRISFSNFNDTKNQTLRSSYLFEIIDDRSPALWVQEVAQRCFQKELSSMVTAPLSKQEVQNAGLSDMGHTDILKRVCGSQDAFMGFIGKHFNVILASAHIPLQKVESSLTEEKIKKAMQVSLDSRKILDSKKKKKPVAVLGLNPHAGDHNLIGNFESQILNKLIDQKNFRGPLVPDAAFLRDRWSQYSFYLAMYHDQGLIPFKSFHGFETGVHLTLGLPIKRTSVDHGTAKDIFGKNKANPGSMIEAIKWGVKLCSIP